MEESHQSLSYLHPFRAPSDECVSSIPQGINRQQEPIPRVTVPEYSMYGLPDALTLGSPQRRFWTTNRAVLHELPIYNDPPNHERNIQFMTDSSVVKCF